MKTLVVSAVLLLSMAQLGYSTLCYNCTMALQDGACEKVANCSAETPFCGTNKINGVFLTYISKFCSAACITLSGNFTIVSATESCCSTDLCNNEKIGDVNSVYLDNGSSGRAGGAFLLVTISGLLSAILAMQM